MQTQIKANIFDIMFSVSNAMDMISTELNNHHKRVAYIAMRIADKAGMSRQEILNITLAGAVHDVGALSYKERVFAKKYEFENATKHATIGYYLLSSFNFIDSIADIVKYHHHHWKYGKGSLVLENNNNVRVPDGAHIIHIADRVEILLDNKSHILNQKDKILEKINKGIDKVYKPEYVEIVHDLAKQDSFWLDIYSPNIQKIITDAVYKDSDNLTKMDLLNYSRLFSNLIDFRSSYTATHNTGVAFVSETLARHCNFNDDDRISIKIAGYLHDLGKLAIPKEILDKPDRLNAEEYNIVRSHCYYTKRILDSVPGIEVITDWASFHHEKLDGSGYPFGYDKTKLPIGSRVISVADIFTALKEDRPYRKGVSDQEAKVIISKLAEQKALDSDVVASFFDNYAEINDVRIYEQLKAKEDYDNFGVKSSKEITTDG